MLIEKTGWITRQNSKLIIQIFHAKFYIHSNGINEALNGEPFGLDIRNCEGKRVGLFNISKEGHFFEMVIDAVRYYSDFDELIKVINNQGSDVEIFRLSPHYDIDPEIYYADSFSLSVSNRDPPLSPVNAHQDVYYQSIIDEGIVLFSRGKPLEAIMVFDKVLSEYPGHPKALFWKNHVKKYAKYPFELREIHKENLEKELERIENDKKK